MCQSICGYLLLSFHACHEIIHIYNANWLINSIKIFLNIYRYINLSIRFLTHSWTHSVLFSTRNQILCRDIKEKKNILEWDVMMLLFLNIKIKMCVSHFFFYFLVFFCFTSTEYNICWIIWQKLFVAVYHLFWSFLTTGFKIFNWVKFVFVVLFPSR